MGLPSLPCKGDAGDDLPIIGPTAADERKAMDKLTAGDELMSRFSNRLGIVGVSIRTSSKGGNFPICLKCRNRIPVGAVRFHVNENIRRPERKLCTECVTALGPDMRVLSFEFLSNFDISMDGDDTIATAVRRALVQLKDLV